MGRSIVAAAGKQRGGLLDPRADERVGVLRPGDRDLDLLERLERQGSNPGASARIIAVHSSTDPRHRAGVVEARREREAALERDEPVGRLEADDAAAGGRDPDRAARCPSRARRRRGSRRARPRSRRSTLRPRGRARAGSGRFRSARSRRSSRRRTRAGSSCRRSRSRPFRGDARPLPSRVGTCSAKIAEP